MSMVNNELAMGGKLIKPAHGALLNRKPSADSTREAGVSIQQALAEDVNETAITRSFFSFLFPWRSQTFLSKAETAPKQVTNCGRSFDGGSLPWTSQQITTPRARLGAVGLPSGSPNAGSTRNGRRRFFKGSVRSRDTLFMSTLGLRGRAE